MRLQLALSLVAASQALSIDELQRVGLTIEELHSNYGNIFSSGNRNAASHLWSSFVLERSNVSRP